MDELVLFAGNSNPLLASRIADYVGKPLGCAKVTNFSDGEIQIEIQENVRGRDVYIIQSTCKPVNDNLVELLLMLDAVKRSAARRIAAVIPYFGYARQDKKVAPRVPISAKLAADMLMAAGANRVITMDLHAGQIQGFFDCPVDNLYAAPVLRDYAKRVFGATPEDIADLVIVSPDAGGVERARAFAKRLNADWAIVDKRRDMPNKAQAMAVIGNVSDKNVIILDDMADTAGTLTEAARALDEKGARSIHAFCTHPVLSGPAVDRIENSPIQTLVATDSIPLSKEALESDKIHILSIADLVGEAIIRSHRGDSVTSLFV
ncbi:ribose-phosphate pyrophosphokinase [Desulfobotulus alkaliphilus]|uniref:Ribose-phosphate pyrophosphokinase n=1 Tax=Desulfobotulus alkaliphilus TaxID=622671 RepID=A0A562RVZ3_9BACT|nr:ribose-phosphate pyrophosphokinase [Desulfobotulus alkaliphilus]TWI73261.1 ribose-phosphate pyrophosphokinase [Desulfobotulus alkaliphilus]